VPKHSCTLLSAIPGITQALTVSSFTKLELPCPGVHTAVQLLALYCRKKIPNFDRKSLVFPNFQATEEHGAV